MAGQPKSRAKREAVLDWLLLKAAEEGMEGESPALEYLESYVASGGTYTGIAAEVSVWSGLEVRRDAVRRAVETLAPDVAARVDRARVHGGLALSEQVIKIADDADEDTVNAAKLQIETRKWVAGTLNPALRPQSGTQVTISLGSQFLEALRHRNVTAKAEIAAPDEAKALPSQVVDAEVVSVE